MTPSEPVLVAIAGGSGAGKTWLARALQQRLGKTAAFISADDFYRDRSHLSPARRALGNFDHPRALDWELLEKVLQQCRRGRLVQLPHYNFADHSREIRMRRWQPRPVVLVEGLWLLRRPSTRKHFALSVYIDCPAKLQLLRRLERDMKERARSEASIREQFRKCVAPMGRRFVLPQARRADVVLRSPLTSQTVDELAERIRGLMLAAPRRRAAQKESAV
jgi:uridine kinase